MTGTFAELWRFLGPEEMIIQGDQWTLRTLFNSKFHGPWGPCDSTLGRRVREVSDSDRIIFRRHISTELQPQPET